MRIVHLITRLIIGGAQENTILSCEGLHARGHEVHLLTGPTAGPEGSLVDRARSGGYHYEEFPDLIRAVHPWHDLRALAALRRRLESLRPDVFHTHSSKAGIVGRIAAHQAGVPAIVHTIHGMSFNRTQPAIVRFVFRWAERFCAGKCHAIVSVADAMTRQALSAGIGRPEQYETIRSGMVVEDFNPQRAGTDRHADDPRTAPSPSSLKPQASSLVRVATVARLFRNKGYEQLIEIMQRAVAMEPCLRFIWIGDGAQRAEYEAELSRRGLHDRVTITGLVPPARMPAILADIDILAHTSQWEGLPRAVVQALLMEKPAVSFDIDGAPEVVIPGQTGELVPLGDIAGFAEAIVRLARDPALRASYGRAGRALCVTEFDHYRMVERLEKLYQRLLK